MKPLLLTILFCAFATATFADDAPTVSDLKANESLIVQIDSSGCFHHSSTRFVFTHDTATIYELKSSWPTEVEEQEAKAEGKKLGTLPISSDDTAKLDALFAFYGIENQIFCTTVDRINIEKLADGKVVATYNYVDGSCGTDRMEGVLTLGALSQRLEAQQKQAQATERPTPSSPDTP